MPYINITETDIERDVTFDTVENAVLIFGFDFIRHKNSSSVDDYNYKLYTSITDFIDEVIRPNEDLVPKSNIFGDMYRPMITAYDCLYQGLPVIWVPLDNYLDENYIISGVVPASSEGGTYKDSESFSYIEYD